MSIHTVITRARAAQEGLFLDACEVRRPLGDPAYNPVTGNVAQPYDVVYTGRCRLLPELSRSSDEDEVGETLIGTPDSTIRFPVDSDIRRDDVAVMTACQYDASAVGREFVVRKAQPDGRQFARIATCEEYVAPAEWEEPS